MAAEAPSFKISMDSISAGLMVLSGLKGWLPDPLSAYWGTRGTPSMTYRGSLERLMELLPRMRTLMDEPGWPVGAVTCTPEACPCKAWSTLETACLPIASPFTVTTAVETFLFSCVPYPTTTTSPRLEESVCSRITRAVPGLLPILYSVVLYPTEETIKTSPADTAIEKDPSASALADTLLFFLMTVALGTGSPVCAWITLPGTGDCARTTSRLSNPSASRKHFFNFFCI